MIDKNQRSQIRALLTSPQWASLELLAKELCAKIDDETIVSETEWLTLQTALMNEGQVRGINRFLKEIYDHANDS